MSISNTASHNLPSKQPETAQSNHDAQTGTAEKKTDAKSNDGTASPKRTPFQAPLRVVPKSPRLLTPKTVATDNQQKPAERDATMLATPPRMVVRGKESIHSPSVNLQPLVSGDQGADVNRVRSNSSPASLSSPSPQPAKSASNKRPAIPSLNLQSLSKQSAASASIGFNTPNNSPINTPTNTATNVSPISSPTKFQSPRGSMRVQIRDTKPISTSAPTTPQKPTRAAPEYQPSSVRRSIKAPGKDPHTAIQPLPSPRTLDKELMSLADEVPGHVIRAMLGTQDHRGDSSDDNKVAKPMRDSDAKTLLRQDLLISVDQFSPALRARLPKSYNKPTISHPELINVLYGQVFSNSPAGKSLAATRKSVMDDYSDNSLTISELAKREQSDPDIRTRYQRNMEDRTNAFADFAFGDKAGRLPGNMISPELFQLWRAMDRELVKLNMSRAERELLAFDMLLTRLALRTAKGDDSEASLAIPSLFYNSVKQACKPVFSGFVAKVIAIFDNERPAPSTTAAPGGGSVSSNS